MSTTASPPNAPWLVLQDGRAGTDGQAAGLAEALEIPYVFVPLAVNGWDRLWPPGLWGNYLAEKLFGEIRFSPAGIIGAGRRAAYGLMAAQHQWPNIKTVQIQNPRVAVDAFSLVITPAHDDLHGPNVIPTLGGLHRITQPLLAEAAAAWHAKLCHDARPHTAILIGGNNKYVKLDDDWIDDTIAKCHNLWEQGHALWVSVSRRTPEGLTGRLRSGLPKTHVVFYDGTGDNPYLGFLALADQILVTADSVSMISEALFTEKPVALLRMPKAGKKFVRFYDMLLASGQTDWFDGTWPTQPRTPLREISRVAHLVRHRIGV